MENVDQRIIDYAKTCKNGEMTTAGFKASIDTMSLSAKAGKVALQALAMAGNMLAGIAISFLIKELGEFINKSKRASEAADELYESSQEKVDTYKEEKKSLDELISKYKELAGFDNPDINTRKDIKDIQQEITDLVGMQAKNLDLVNGKLDEELGKLNDISEHQIKFAYETAVGNYYNAKDASDKAMGENNRWEFWRNESTAYSGKEEKDVYDALKKAGFKVSSEDHIFNQYMYISDTTDRFGNSLDNAADKANYILEIINFLEKNALSDTDAYTGLQKQYYKYRQYAENQSVASNSMVDSFLEYNDIYNFDLSKIKINSAEAIEKYKQTMFEAAKGNIPIADALSDGFLSEENIKRAIDDFIATNDKFVPYYSQWAKDFSKDGKINKTFETDNFIKKFAEHIKKLNLTEDSVEELKNLDWWDGENGTSFTNPLHSLMFRFDALQMPYDSIDGLIEKLVELGYIQKTTFEGKEDFIFSDHEDSIKSYKDTLSAVSEVIEKIRDKSVGAEGININELMGMDEFANVDKYIWNEMLTRGEVSEEDMKSIAINAWEGIYNSLKDCNGSEIIIQELKDDFEKASFGIRIDIAVNEKAYDELIGILDKVQNGMTFTYEEITNYINAYGDEIAGALTAVGDAYTIEEDVIISLINKYGELTNAAIASEVSTLRMAKERIEALGGIEAAQEIVKDIYTHSPTEQSRNYAEQLKQDINDAIAYDEYYDSWKERFNKLKELSSSSSSDFEQKIDLASQSITTLQQNLSSLQNALSDVSGYKNQIEAIDNIIKAQGNLYTGYEHSRDLYQKQYENSLNNGILAKHGLSKLVKEKIESGAPFFNEDSIEKDIKSGNISITQQDYENINDAISWYNKVLEAEENLTKTKSEIDESKLSKYDVLRKKSEAYIDTLKNSQKRITDTIDFNGNKATEEQYNNLILYQMGIRKVLEDRYEYESNLLETLTPETDQYTEQEKLVRECADGLAECDKNIKDWRLDMLRLELEAIDDEIDSINDKIKANQDEIDEKDKLISGAIGILNQEVKVQEGLRDVIQERIDALQEENDEHERALALEKAKYELQRAYSQRTVKLYSGEERGFIYTQDREAVRDAQENLDKLEYEETIHALQEQVGYYDDIIDNLNAIKDSWSNISSAAQEFLEIESVIAKYGVGIKDSILSGSYDTDGLTQSYKGLLHLGEEFDNDLKKQEDLRSDLEKSIEQFQNGTITLEQCLTDIGTLLGKVYDISESELQEKAESILRSIGFLPSEADNAGNTVKALEKEVKNSTGSIKDDMNQIAEDVDDTSSIAAGKVTENLTEETDKQRIIITDFAGYIDYVFTTMCNTILSIFQLLSNAVKDIFAPANTELADIEPGAMSNGSTTANDGKDLTQSAPSIGEEYTTASTYQEGKAVLTPFQNEQFETLIKNIPNMSALIPYHAVFTPNLNNSPTSITPVVQNVTLTLPNVTNENGYNNLVDALKSLPLDTVQYTHKK